MDVVMAGGADHEGFASFSCHERETVGKLWLVVGLQQETRYLADQFVRPRRQAKRRNFPFFFGMNTRRAGAKR